MFLPIPTPALMSTPMLRRTRMHKATHPRSTLLRGMQLHAALALACAAPLGPAMAQTPATIAPAVVNSGAVPTAVCTARSSATVAPVVELYTSEGCNSCPPADKWLSRLKADPNVVGLAFHVDYWDRLGWKDRFASPAYTQRQAQQQASNGARFSYTPQVVLDGRDHKDWYAATPPSSARSRATATVALALVREGERITATVQPAANAPARLAAFWAVTENGHATAVKAGENDGVTLTHDFVVREYTPVAAWVAQPGTPVSLSFTPTLAASPNHPRHVNLVVLDAATGRPVQALKLGC